MCDCLDNLLGSSSPSASDGGPNGTDGGSAADGAPTACGCTVKITPNPLELYVSEPNESLRTLTAIASPAGGTFTWTSSDTSKLTISGSGSKVTVQGLDEGDVTVRVDYSPPACAACSDQANVKVKYEVRHILVAQGIQFNNAQLDPDDQVPGGYLNTQLSAAAPFPLQVSGTSATFKSVKQGVKYIIDVTTDRTEFKKKLETPGNPGTKELEYWHVIYDGHSRFGRGACFGTDDSPGENWENSSDPAAGPNGLYRMGHPYVGVPASDVLHHGYTTDVIATKVPKTALAYADRDPAVAVHETTLASLKAETKKRSPGLNVASLDSQLRIVGDRKPMVQIGDPVRSSDIFWGCFNEGPAVMLQAGWSGTVSAPMDLGATNLKCRVFCHFGCESFAHYRDVLRNRKNWKKAGNSDRFAYFTSSISYSATGSFWLYHLLTYDKFNAGLPWEPSLEYARQKSKKDLSDWCTNNGVTPYEIL